MEITIRQGIKKDLPSVLKLIKELAEYENSLDQATITLKELENDGFGDHPWYWFLVAEKGSKIIGVSFYWVRYSTWKGKILFLEDFVITKKYRMKGIGSKLFEETIKTCQKLDVNGMSWQVLDWNVLAMNFYKKYNADINKNNQWVDGKLTKKQIDKICSLKK
tara:strand:+ start:1280 stop:1768 length:489 start_codon:yes stop_codon:yes gene_type:complete